ncbi:alpha-tectorin-like [Protopterus annectens]|uniref:alpha-tectorin-like n=1 Tax=Protopterus annectens TaxID=7888 RepID=UPI001CFB5A0C|nr:alpha-tectorin-like [Protopterus annectens]XP_043936440.1 alpha-tectorin-like [Protopterus annectens]XP_043936441.1 alpha-tectorin-like [Protopterus annectens]
MKTAIFTIHFILLELTCTSGQTTDAHLYPFGTSEGDKSNPKVDDSGSPAIPIAVVFHFFETSYSSLYVNNNGVVSFGVAVSQYTPDAFPLADGRAFVAPFWADIHSGLYGEVYYRESKNDQIRNRATADIRRYFPDLQFTATWVFVATWDRVAYYGSSSRKANTFQAVLISDGSLSFIVLNYGKIEWTTGTASGGAAATGLGGTAAQAGFNSGNSKHYFNIPGSRTSSILNIGSTSNVNYPGRWVFRADVFSVVGGCTYNARFLRNGDVFWPENNCEKKCKCSEDKVICQNEGCSAYEKCQSSSWYYICKTVGSKTCSAFGDPHYHTFDGRLFHFQGTCTYVLSMVCANSPNIQNLTTYRIEVKNENRGNALVSWTRLVRVITYGTEIIMTKDNTDHVMVNNITTSLPLSLMNGRIKVYKSGFSVTITTDYGLVASYEGNNHISVSVPLNYFNSTCGLCGTLTNDMSDDFLTSTGKISQSEELFAKSWKVQENDASCRDDCNGTCPTCTPEKQAIYARNDYCGKMGNPQGPFSACSSVLSPNNFIESCAYDLCSIGNDMTTLCDALTSYSARCQSEGAQIQLWRSPSFCGITCPENSHYQFCATACPASCADSTAPLYCTQPCKESCVCNDGYILSVGRCVPLSQCGCQYQGRYYDIGEEVITTDNCSTKCKCINSNSGMDCQNYGCMPYEECKIKNGARGCYPAKNGTCWTSGDPHYHTFDDRPFDFQGICRYTLSKYCGSLTHLVNFSVKVVNEHRGGSTVVSWTREVQLTVYSHEIVMTSGEKGRVKVNGSSTNLPLSLDSDKIHIYQSGSSATVQTYFGLSLSYDWRYLVKLTLPATYEGQLCGLCGNFNGNGSDDFTMPNSSLAMNALSFGKSWIEPNSSASCLPTEEVPECSEGKRQQYSSSVQCGIITAATGPFRNCHDRVDSSIYFENCVYDLCAMNGDQSTLCEAVKSYAVQCQGHGITVDHWRNITRCALPCPANSHYEICGSPCPASCANISVPFRCPTPCTEVCQCDNGFALSGMECVPLSECGCTYNNRYYKAGEVFWMGRNCQEKCMCDAVTKNVQCSSSSCASTEICGDKNGFYGCHRLPDGVCRAGGDPHYMTFDRLSYDFQGTCRYIFAELCNSSDTKDYFRIEVANENWVGVPVSVTAEVFIFVYNTQIEFHRGNPGIVKVNGRIVNLPVYFNQSQIVISSNGVYTVMRTSFGLTITYDMNSILSVTIVPEYRGRTCGLCGNFNGQASDDFTARSGSLVSNAFLFASDWKTQDNSRPGCNNGCHESCPVCTKESLPKSISSCGIIKAIQGPFSLCHSDVDPEPFVQNCIYDVCLSGNDNTILCQSIQAYVVACQTANITVLRWRNQTSCGFPCPANSHYEICGSSCPASCINLGFPISCSTPCTEVCQCDDGFVQSGTDCVPVAQCGCTYNNRYYKAGEVFWMGSKCEERCMCDAATKSVQCNSSSCTSTEICGNKNGIYGCHRLPDGVCRAGGDPHYMTFDRLSYDFQGTCRYIFAELCNSSDTKDYFRIEVANENWVGVPVSVTAEVFIFVYNTQIEFLRGKPGTVKVNGKVVNLPLYFNQTQMGINWNGVYIVLRTEFGLTVTYDMNSILSVMIAPEYRGRTCGLCGNFNGQTSDDFTLRLGSVESNAFHFASDWKTQDNSRPGCNNGCHESCPVCTKDQIAKAASSCGIIKDTQGPFTLCHSDVDPEPFVQNCIYDVCLSGNDNAILCQSIQAYVAACQAGNITVLSWRNQTSCGLPCPANSHYEICGSSCPTTCVNLEFLLSCSTPCTEVCQCDDGFVQSGTDCVPVAQCGCTYNNRYYKSGEVFWMGNNCEERCMCDAATKSVQCSSSSCTSTEICGNKNGIYGCHRLPDGVCRAGGDPHYMTFDRLSYDFQGTCRYIFAELCNSSDVKDYFRIEVANENWVGVPVSVTSEVFIFIYNTQIEFHRGNPGKVMVNGIIVSLPVYFNQSQITVFRNGAYTVMKTSFGLTVTYDMSSILSVTIAPEYRGRTCGLCGNFNGHAFDDFTVHAGSLVQSAFLFASDWKTQDNSRDGCSNGCHESCPVCSKEHLAKASLSCSIIKDAKGPFALCHSDIDPEPFAQNCIYDVCLSGNDDAILSQSIQAYVGACQSANINVLSWRNETFCAMQCPQNSHYEQCGHNCFTSCAPGLTSSYCNTPCFEGCFCNDDFLLSGDSCVPADQCGCVHNGVYHTVGDIFWTEGCTQKCNCLSPNNLRCVPSNCNETQQCTARHGKLGCLSTFGTCTVGGDPHYYTFDGSSAHFQGSCSYEIAKTCNHSSDFGFTVSAENRRRGNPHVSYVSRAEVQLWSGRIQAKVILGASRTVQVNGENMALPASIESLASISQFGNMVVLKTSREVEVHYDGLSTLIVRVGKQYKNALCGMCGNFNDDPKDDKTMPNGEAARKDQQFGNAWKSPNSRKGCEDDTETTKPVCDDLKEKESLCKIITEAPGPFVDCHWHVDPMPYYTSCVYDLCHYGTANRMLCTAIGSYQEVCQTHGVEIPTWQTSVNCSLPSPCETHMCTDNEWCGEYYGEYGCYCYDSSDKEIKNSYDYKANCTGSSSFVSLSRCMVFTDGVQSSALHLNDPQCTGRVQDGRLIFPFDTNKRTCGMKMQVNATHFIYYNAIQGRNEDNYGSVSNRGKKVYIGFTCEYPLTINTSSPSSGKPVESVIKAAFQSGLGSYEAKMMLYRDSNYSQRFTDASLALRANDKLYVGIIVTGIDPNMYVTTLASCWTTVKKEPSSSSRKDLIINQCPNPKDYDVAIDEDGESPVGRFSFVAFNSVKSGGEIYLHCRIQLCNIQKTTCSADCLEMQPPNDEREEPKDLLTCGPISQSVSTSGTKHNSFSLFILVLLFTVIVFVPYK